MQFMLFQPMRKNQILKLLLYGVVVLSTTYSNRGKVINKVLYIVAVQHLFFAHLSNAATYVKGTTFLVYSLPASAGRVYDALEKG